MLPFFQVSKGLAWLLNGWDGKLYSPVKPDISRITTQKKYRVKRIECLGNAIVPQVAYELFQVIKEIENANN